MNKLLSTYELPIICIFPFLKFEILFPTAAICKKNNSLTRFINFTSVLKFIFSITNFLRDRFFISSLLTSNTFSLFSNVVILELSDLELISNIPSVINKFSIINISSKRKKGSKDKIILSKYIFDNIESSFLIL